MLYARQLRKLSTTENMSTTKELAADGIRTKQSLAAISIVIAIETQRKLLEEKTDELR